MSISGWKKLNKRLNSFIKTASKLNYIIFFEAKKQKQSIIERTKSGRNINNSSFAKYKNKSKNVDLTDTGKMLSSIRTYIKPDGAFIAFDDLNQQQKALRHQFGTNNMPKREFFGLSTNQKKQIISNLKKRIKL